MADISCDIVVVGAGVLGLCVASELTARGRDVRVIDPGRANASSIAAGMIAPAFETVLDGGDAERGAFLRDAAALWPAFAGRFGLSLDRTPAEWRGPQAGMMQARLAALGFEATLTAGGVAAPEDIRLEAGASLQAMSERLGPRRIGTGVDRLARHGPGWRINAGDTGIRTTQVIVATGVAAAVPGLPHLASSLIAAVCPIKGQIGWTADVLTDRVLRGPGGYVAPVADGTLIGATMVEGARDLTVDPAATDRLLAMAQLLTGHGVVPTVQWRVGVRGASADGLPIAGPVGDGLHLALAPRRNGWLLGPMVARVVADGIEGRPRDRHAAALDPLRFNPPAD
ncbi:NAD(P)/FAD-dependent oxidoreductase [Brevundimonas subvibrioides]|uniref:NAD(P)/FAD-dependent oxidoreductase n=1 Tax=Brevundimonas subvibrioides TaxID=74313 RepID=UPI0022B56B74|nr:FAD-dependent oxidoreductase [Brevundimonas subvibrioides]